MARAVRIRSRYGPRFAGSRVGSRSVLAPSNFANWPAQRRQPHIAVRPRGREEPRTVRDVSVLFAGQRRWRVHPGARVAAFAESNVLVRRVVRRGSVSFARFAKSSVARVSSLGGARKPQL